MRQKETIRFAGKKLPLMKRNIITSLFLFFTIYSFSQVAIGTTNPSEGSAFQIDSETGALVPPRMTATQMANIQNPLQGAMVFNTTSQDLFTFNGIEWHEMVRSLPTILMNRDGGTNFTLSEDTYYQFPLGSSHVNYIDSDYYTVVSAGKIEILQDGIYNISCGLSTNNLPVGNRKYVIGIYRNGTLIGYPNRGEISILNNDPSGNYWGSSGVLTYLFNANDIVDIRYVINKDSGVSGTQSAPVRILNLAITKVN